MPHQSALHGEQAGGKEETNCYVQRSVCLISQYHSLYRAWRRSFLRPDWPALRVLGTKTPPTAAQASYEKSLRDAPGDVFGVVVPLGFDRGQVAAEFDADRSRGPDQDDFSS